MSSHASRIRARLWNPPNARQDTENALGRQSNATRALESHEVVVDHPKASAQDRCITPTEIFNSMRRIQIVVAEAYGVGRIELMSRRRGRLIVRPRQIAMYLCATLTDRSTTAIGRQFNRDHTTILHARNKITILRRVDENLNAQINSIVEKLGMAGDDDVVD